MMRRRASTRAAVACVVLLSLIVAASAAAGFKSGRYAGTTDQGTEISFKATDVGVKKFAYEVSVSCEDGTHESSWGGAADPPQPSAKAPITENGRFTAEFVTGDITSVVKGKLKRRKASGTIDTGGTLPKGSECWSSVDWSAERQ
jgi:hypothetical protein